MKLSIIAFTLLLLFACNALAVAPQQATIDNISPLAVLECNKVGNGVDLSIMIDEPIWETVGARGQPVTVAEYLAGGVLEVEGYPSVPVAGAMFRLLPRSGVTVEVIEAEYETYTDVEYATYFGVEDPEGYVPSPNPEDSWYPGILADISGPAIFHDFRVTSLATYPVQVNTARNEVRIYSNIQVAIRYEGTDDRNTLDTWPVKISEAFLPWYRQFLDWDEDELDEYELYRGNVQVVMRDNDILWEEMEPWIEWKLQKGWELEFLTDDDIPSFTATGIRNELQDRYDEADPKFDYVVIVGDDAGSFPVPPGTGSGYGAGDLGYSQMVGNDLLPDVHVGRITAETATHIAAYVNKVLTYERDPNLDNTDWYLKGAVSASSASTGTSSIYVGRFCRRAMLDLGYTGVDTAWYNDGLGGVNGRDIQHINAGVSFYNHRGWLSTGLNTGEIQNLNNVNENPMIFDVTCGTGNWAGGYGINEAWMRGESSVQNPNAGIGGIGTATSGTHTKFNNCLNGGTALSMLVMRNPCMGDMLTGAKVNLWNNFIGPNPGSWTSYLTWLNLMGDPTCWMWTGIPKLLDVSAADEIDLGTNGYSVTVLDDDTNEPVEGAWVTLYKVDDDESIIARGYSDINGTVTLNAPIRYSGDAMLTVTKPLYAPYRLEVDINSTDDFIGYVNVTFQDNGNDGTSGNSNGKPEAGETVGLVITAGNFGVNQATNVTATASSEDAWIVDVTGTAEFGTINTGAEQTATSLILVEIDEQGQHDWNAHIQLEFNSDQSTSHDDYPLRVNAAMFALVNYDIGEGGIDPGETRNLTVTVANVGGSDAVGTSDAVLISTDPFMRVEQGIGTFPEMNMDTDGESSNFTITAHEYTYPGHLGGLKLVITTGNGQMDTVSFRIPVGQRLSTDPTGPDQYGYYAFDDTDVAYEDYVPVFNWVEINPGEPENDYNGINVGLNDTGDDNDDAETIDLDFPIQYYGVQYDQLTICSNGWVAMGNQMDVRSQRNWIIPSPLGPNDMVAVLWDELTTQGNADVFYYYDEPNNRFIVEWYNMPDLSNAAHNTFEVIFYDQVGDHETRSGDTDILFQYGDFELSTCTANGADIPYFTTGIENHDQTDGIMMEYWNDPTPGSAPVVTGRAYFFTTNVVQLTGEIMGLVIDAETLEPVEDATVIMDNGEMATTTGAEGLYGFQDVLIGLHNLQVQAECYNSQLAVNVEVFDSEMTVNDFALLHPEIELSEDITEELFPDQESTRELIMTNPGNGVLTYSAYVFFQDPQPEPPVMSESFPQGSDGELDELIQPWDWAYTFDLTEEESRNNGICFIGDYFWVSGSDNYDQNGPNKLYQYDRYGELIATFNQPVEEPGSAGFFGMAWDGEYLYGADQNMMFQMEMALGDTGQVVSVDYVDSWEIPVNPARYIAYDPDNDLFWIGDYGSEIRAVNRQGEIIHDYGQDFFPRGAAWYAGDEQGYNLCFIGRSQGERMTQLVRMDPATGDYEIMYSFETDAGDYVAAGASMTGEWNPYAWTLVSILEDSPQDQVNVWVVDRNVDYFEIVNPDGTLESDTQRTIEMVFRGSDLPYGTYRLYVGFNDNSCDDENNSVAVTMILPDTAVVGVPYEVVEQPLDWEFRGVYPNPFNPLTVINFTLREHTPVRAKVFNLLGKQVSVLADRSISAGRHELQFDGTGLASGIYFLRFEAGPLNEVRKLVLMK